MARNDEFFLNRWVAHYGKMFGEENLFIYLDGVDQKRPAGAGNANVRAVPRHFGGVRRADKLRIDFLSDRARELFGRGYDIVIGTDADEFIVLDPRVKMSMAEYLSRKKFRGALSPLGLDFAQHLKLENHFDRKRPFLDQRSFALIHSRFTKASIINRPLRWGRGFHRVKRRNFRIDPNLYLLHMGNVDFDLVAAKMNHPDIVAQDLTRHYRRNRMRIFKAVTEKKAADGDAMFRWARLIQTVFRPPWSWNKPAMLGLSWIIKMPERFKGAV